MSDIETSRVVNVGRVLAKEFECSICLHLLSDPVDTDCGHTFCRECIGRVIQRRWRRLVCPECRQEFTVGRTETDDQWLLRRNRRLANIIGKLEVKCEWADAHGCPRVLEVQALAAHRRSCPYRPCNRCGLSFGGHRVGHDCVRALLNDRKELVNKMKRQDKDWSNKYRRVVNKCERLTRQSHRSPNKDQVSSGASDTEPMDQ